MVYRIFFYILSALFLNPSVLATAMDPRLNTKRPVEIEWEQVKGAIKYELDLMDYQTKKSLKVFSSPTHLFKLNVRMGKYHFKSRIFDLNGSPSEWSEVSELVIGPPPTKLKNQVAGKSPPVFADKQSGFGKIPLSWDAIEGISNYKIILENAKGEKVKEYTVASTTVNLTVIPGDYRFKIAPILPDGSLGEESAPSSLYTVIGAKIDPPVIKLSKVKKKTNISVETTLSRAEVFGVLEFMPLEGEEWSLVQKIDGLKNADFPLLSQSKPGLYRLTLQSKAKGFLVSDPAVTEYLVKPVEPEFVEIPVAVSDGFGYQIQGYEEAKLALENLRSNAGTERLPAEESSQVSPKEGEAEVDSAVEEVNN